MKPIRLILAATLMLASGMAMAGDGVAYGYGPYGWGGPLGPCDDPPCGGGPELATDTLDPVDTPEPAEEAAGDGRYNRYRYGSKN